LELFIQHTIKSFVMC